MRGYNSLQIGTVMIVWGAFQFLSAPIAGLLDRRVDPRLIMAFGFALCATELGLNSHMTADIGPRELFWPQAVFGFSVIFMMVPMASVALGRCRSSGSAMRAACSTSCAISAARVASP